MINLYEYQKQYLAELPARAVMAADTGTGKTFMALAHYAKHAAGQPLLILAPASKVRTGDWEREIDEFFAGLPAEQRQFTYEVWSYEKFSRDPTLQQFKDGKRALWHKYVPKHGGTQHAVICDEVHRAKNPSSKVGRSVYQATVDASFFVGLSATPLPNGWIDFANYSKIFGFTKNVTEFKKKYVQIVTYKGFPEITGYNNVIKLKRQWQSISKLLQKKDALDLPARTFKGVNFKRPTVYVKTILDRKDEDGNLLETAGALMHAIRKTLTAGKMEYLSDLLEGTTENVVIFYNYVSEREAILEMLAKKHKTKTVFRQDGEAHELPAKGAWKDVHNSVTLAHYMSGSTGVEMTYATQVIYFSPTYSFADYMQSIGRVYRNGQTEKTTFYNFRTPNTVEEDIYKCLRGKNNFQVEQWVSNLKEK